MNRQLLIMEIATIYTPNQIIEAENALAFEEEHEIINFITEYMEEPSTQRNINIILFEAMKKINK